MQNNNEYVPNEAELYGNPEPHIEPYREIQKLHEAYGGTEASAFLVFAHLANNLFVSIEMLAEAMAKQNELLTKLLESQSK